MKVFDKLLNWYFRRSSLPYWIILILDCIIIFASAVIVHWMFFRGYQTLIHYRSITDTMLIYLLISVFCFKVFSTYSGIIRFSSFVDLQRVAYANGTALFLCLVAHYGINRLPSKLFMHFTAYQIVLIFVIATAGMWAMRVLVKILYDVTNSNDKAKRVLIYGVNDGAISVAKAIRSQKPAKYVLRGFISPYRQFQNHTLMGVRVLRKTEHLPYVLKKQDIDAILVSPIRKIEFSNDQKLQDILISAGVKIYMAEQHIWDSDNENEDTSQKPGGVLMKEVSVEDLLPRDEINVDLESVGEELSGKRILITGSAGSIGSEIVRQVATFHPASMMLIDQAETPEHDIRLMMKRKWADINAHTVVTSICNPDRMEKIFSEFRPDYVFHAAAYKHVPMMEDNPSEAVHNNVYGTRILADLSVKYGVRKFVMISTDKAVNPTNVMGCSKRICEIYVQSLNHKLEQERQGQKNTDEADHKRTQFITTRFGNVLGSNGSVIPIFKEQIKKGGPVTVTDPNIIRFFMLIPEACKLVLEAGTKGHGGEIFVFDMGKPVRIADLAQRMINLSGAHNVKIKYTGLRPGEKLYEEVLGEAENTLPSFHEKIRIAQVREYDYEEACRNIDELFDVAQQFDDMATVRVMKKIVPEFKSNNSIYEVLDKKE